MKTPASRHPRNRLRVITQLLMMLLLALFLSVSLIMPSLFQTASAEAPDASVNANPANPAAATPKEADAYKPHLLASTYYNLNARLKTILKLNNKAPHPVKVRPSLYSLGGQRLDLPAITVEATSFRMIDMRELVAPENTLFQEGSLHLTYRGPDYTIGAQVKIVDEQQSLIFDEQMPDLGTAYGSTRLEGVWWLPTQSSEFNLVLSNTSDMPLSVTMRVDGTAPKQKDLVGLSLSPHETRVLDMRRGFGGEKGGRLLEAGGISLEHSGDKGALLARGLIQEAAVGYSSAVNFSDPSKSRSSELHGAGFRLGKLDGEELIPVVVARNTGTTPTVLTGSIPYTARDGSFGSLSLPELRLAPGETRSVNLKSATKKGVEEARIASLAFKYTGEPGSVVLSALSMSQSRNQVFHVPLTDPAAQRASAGRNPLMIDGSSSSRMYIKNVTDRPQQYVAYLHYAGGAGTYMLGLRTIEAQETVAIDMRALRDSQTPDTEGHTLPADISNAQLAWSLVEGDSDGTLALIGRAEQFDVEQAVSSTYSCGSCCLDSYYDSYVTPDAADIEAGDITDFDAYQLNQDCYGTVYPIPKSASWSSSSTAIATVDSSGKATGQGEGEVDIIASWSGRIYNPNPYPCGPYYYRVQPGYDAAGEPNMPACGSCSSTFIQARPRGRVRVRLTPHQVRVISDTGNVARTDCPSIVTRQVHYQTINRNGRAVNRTIGIQELLTGQSANTCGNGLPTAPPCAVTGNGQFFDTLSMTCGGVAGAATDPSCGFTQTQTLQTCAPTAVIRLALVAHYIRANQILLNGSAQFAAGTVLPR